MKDNREYYDDFSDWYERERHHGYHALIDRLQVGLARPYCVGKDILELGCGTGLILKELAPYARSAMGLDISAGMLASAQSRGLDVVQGSVTDLPFADASFDVVYSFKVLAHVQAIDRTLQEVARVLRPGGHALLEFYNKNSLRYVVKRLKRPHAVSAQTTDDQVYTRYDRPKEIERYLPPQLKLINFHGIRVVTPFAQVHRVPGLRRALALVERAARDRALTARFGGFLVVHLQRT